MRAEKGRFNGGQTPHQKFCIPNFIVFIRMLGESCVPHLSQVLLKSLEVPAPLHGIRNPYLN